MRDEREEKVENDYPYGDDYYKEEEQEQSNEEELREDQEFEDEAAPLPDTYKEIYKDNYNKGIGTILNSNIHLGKYISAHPDINVDIENETLYSNADILLICNLGTDYAGPNSSVYKTYEMYHRLQKSNIHQDLGGLKIQLLFCNWFDNPRTLALEFFGNEIIKAILTKYTGSRQMYQNLQRDIIFMKNPKKIILAKSTIPYEIGYNPTSVVIVDWNEEKSLANTDIQADNLHIVTERFSEEAFTQHKNNFNFFCVYSDFRNSTSLIRSQKVYQHPRVIQYNNIERILFDEFAPIENDIYNDNDPEHLKDTTKFLIYIKNRDRNLLIKEADDIVDSVPIKYLNPLGQQIRKDKGILRKQFEELNKSKKLTKIQREAVKFKGLIQNTIYDQDAIYNERASITFIIIGLCEENRDFEDILIARAAQKGILINTIVFNQNQLPLTNLFAWFDIYIYNNTNKQEPSRFIPECKYHNKKIVYSKKVKSNIHYNFGLKIRINDTETHFSILDEYTHYHPELMLPKSKLLKNLLGYWKE